MTAPVNALAADAQPPTPNSCQRVATGAASAVLALAANLIGRFVTIQNEGTFTIFFLFGDSTDVVLETAVSGDTACLALAPGERVDYRLPKNGSFVDAGGTKRTITSIIHKSPGGASILRVSAS